MRATRAIAERCAFTLADLGYTFPSYPVPPGETQQSYLEKLAWRGRRRAATTPAIRCCPRCAAQLARELGIIGRLGLAGYFLIVWDIVQFAKSRGHHGPGARLGGELGRLLSSSASPPSIRCGWTCCSSASCRRSASQNAGNVADRMPDIDLDLPSGDRRELVIQHVYEKYGARGAAMTANVITYRPRMAVRDAGRALGLSEEQLDRIAKHLPGWLMDDGDAAGDLPGDGGFPPTRSPQPPAGRASRRRCCNLPRHLGQHSGGMVIAAGRLDDVVPLEPASMPGRVIVQWDKDDCADLGIVKVDLLGLGMMAVLEEAVPLIQRHEGVDDRLRALPRRRSEGLRRCCAPPTPSACSRSNRARRWRRCRA